MTTEAIVVRAVDFGEADRIVTLLTRSTGKVSVLARGARRSRKRFDALELFASGEAHIKERRGELWSLESFHILRGFSHLSLDVAKVAHGAYVCELARELLPPHHADPRLYGLLHETLSLLDAMSVDTLGGGALHLRLFELALLDGMGLAPSLGRCVSCDAAVAAAPGEPEMVHFDVQRGGVICARCAADGPTGRRLPRAALGVLERIQAHALCRGLDQLPELRASLEVFLDDAGPRETTLAAVRDAVQALLNAHLARPLRSLEFINKLNSAHLEP